MRTSIVLLLAATACDNFAPGPAIVSLTPAEPTTTDDIQAVIDQEAWDPEGATLEYRFNWYRDGTTWSERGPDTVGADNTAKGELWRVEVTAYDGSSAGDAIGAEVTIGNTPPTVELAFENELPSADDDLVVIATPDDIDGDAVTLDWSWTRDGQPTGHGDGTIPAADTLRWQTWEATVVPHDGDDAGEPVVISVIVDNSPPTVNFFTLSPDPAYEDSVLRTSIEVVDPDGETASVTYEWYVDDALVLEGSATTMSGTYFDKNQEVYVIATASDSVQSADPVTSNTVTVLNTAPTIGGASIDPSTLYEGSTATCVAENLEDEDGDTLTPTYSWYVGGSLVSSDESINGDLFDRGDTVSCSVRVNDGEEDSATASSDSITVLNTEPVISSVSITPSSPTEEDTLEATISDSDDDGDALSYSYAWYVNGSLASANSQLTGSHFDKHQYVSVTVTPYDGYVHGTTVSSSAVEVLNTAPDFTSLTTSPDEAILGDTITAVPSGWNDADGDPESYTYRWTVEGSVVSSNDSLNLASYSRGSEVQVQVTAWDGETTGTVLTSDAMAIRQVLDPTDAVGQFSGDSSEEAGQALALAGDITGDGVPDVIVGAPTARATVSATNAGAVYVVSGTMSGSLSYNQAEARLLGGETDDAAGTSVSWAGDVDGDGWDDLIVGVPGDATYGTDAGMAYLVLGPVNSDAELADAGVAILGTSASQATGYSVAGGGDLDQDGFDDIVIGAHGTTSDRGAVYLGYGPITSLEWVDTMDVRLSGRTSGDMAGWSVAMAGDLDGDGADDVLIGAPAESTAASDAGAAYVLYGPVTTNLTLSSADATLTGEAADDQAGHVVSGAGDVDGDGLDDLLVGAPGNDDGATDAGATYLVLGSPSGSSSLSAATAKLEGTAASELAGSSLTSLGDVDGDGHDDLAISAPGAALVGPDAGSVYVLSGPLTGTLDLTEAAYARIDGAAVGDSLGTSLAGGWDLDGDGLPELAIGAPYQSDGGSSAGTAYLFEGAEL